MFVYLQQGTSGLKLWWYERTFTAPFKVGKLEYQTLPEAYQAMLEWNRRADNYGIVITFCIHGYSEFRSNEVAVPVGTLYFDEDGNGMRFGSDDEVQELVAPFTLVKQDQTFETALEMLQQLRSDFEMLPQLNVVEVKDSQGQTFSVRRF